MLMKPKIHEGAIILAPKKYENAEPGHESYGWPKKKIIVLYFMFCGCYSHARESYSIVDWYAIAVAIAIAYLCYIWNTNLNYLHVSRDFDAF